MPPRIIHQLWIGDRPVPEKYRQNQTDWREKNPEWEYRFWGNDRVEELISRQDRDIRRLWVLLASDPYGTIKRADLARMLIIHEFGGVYLDMDLVPVNSLETLFSADRVYNRNLQRVRQMPDIPSADFRDVPSYSLILSFEHCAIDQIGHGVANGVLIADAGCKFFPIFINEQMDQHRGKVLDFVGTWAWTRFIRRYAGQMKGNTLILPPHYFLWETHWYDGDPKDWTISKHPAENTWGDKTKAEWWSV